MDQNDEIPLKDKSLSVIVSPNPEKNDLRNTQLKEGFATLQRPEVKKRAIKISQNQYKMIRK